MNAQEKWKQRYRMFSACFVKRGKHDDRLYMRIIRREAALERIIARLQRRIDYLEADLKLAQQQTAESEERREFAARAWAERN